MINKFFGIGRLTKDPELRTSNNGNSISTFTLAIDRRGKDAGTDFLNCVSFKGTAEAVSKYTKKGSQVAVSGSVQVRQYEDKNGNKRSTTEILCDEVQFLGSKGDAKPHTIGEPEKHDEMFEEGFTPVDEDDLPFK